MPREPSPLERDFLLYWRGLHPELPGPVREYRAIDGRRFRFDFGFPDHRVLVSIQGGTWSKGRHTRGTGYERDCEKLNLAQAAGYKVFYLTTTMLSGDPGRWLDLIAEAIKGE